MTQTKKLNIFTTLMIFFQWMIFHTTLQHYQQVLPRGYTGIQYILSGGGWTLLNIFSLIREPDAWWIGQFVGYLMRPNETVKHILDEAEKNINFSSPVVGVHVR